MGCGTAGPAAALLLARAGWRVTVIERVAEPGAVGAGILLQPIGMHVLDRLGLLGEVLRHGARIDRLHGINRRGRSVLDTRYADLSPDLFGVGLHRGVLFSTLYGALQAPPLAEDLELRCGLEVTGLEERGEEVVVHAEDGALGAFDLVILADGARSQLAPPNGPKKRVRPYPWGALWAVVEDPEQVFPDTLFQVYRGCTHMLGFLPTGREWAGGETLGPPLTSLFWSIRADRIDAWRARGLAAWLAECRPYEPRAEPLLAQLRDPDQILFARYYDVKMKRWHGGRCVVLGDSAHATSPQLGQGANLALFDAMVLADALGEGSDVAAGLERYSAARKGHLGYYQWVTRFLTPFFQSSWAPLGWLRDLFMPFVLRRKMVRRIMLDTLAGVSTGLSSRMPLTSVTGYLSKPEIAKTGAPR